MTYSKSKFQSIFLLLVLHNQLCSSSTSLDDEQWSLGPTFGFGRQQSHKATNPTSRTVNDLRSRATEGNPEAQYFLGLLMWYGDGVATDRDMAMDFFRRAAKQGHIHAQFNVGLILASCWVPCCSQNAYFPRLLLVLLLDAFWHGCW